MSTDIKNITHYINKIQFKTIDSSITVSKHTYHTITVPNKIINSDQNNSLTIEKVVINVLYTNYYERFDTQS